MASGFKINYRKTKYAGKQIVTGIEIFNNYIDAPEAIIQKAKEEENKEEVNGPYSNYLKRIRKTNH